MAEIEINDLANIGNVRDIPTYQMPPEAWSVADNVRFYNEGIEQVGGRTQVFGTPGVAPHFALPISSTSESFWLYVSLTKGYVYNGTTHTDITRAAGGDYTATQTRDWNGTLLGGVPILNNGSDVPQFWATLAPATDLANLTNWPTLLRAKVIRAFSPFLMAFNLVENSVAYPHAVQWSHPADPGSVPSSWDITDPTTDAGRVDLADVEAGTIQEALPLAGRMYIYKEGSVWRSTFVGGQSIFDFKVFLETSGILAPRCVTLTGDGQKHVVASQDDILLHNGVNAESILSKRYKKYLFNQIDTTNFKNSFMFTNPAFNEIMFCYPEQGSVNPTRALKWSYNEGKLGAFSEEEVDYRNVATGTIQDAAVDTWASVSGTWDSYMGPWSQVERRKLVACDPANTQFLALDVGTTFDEAPIQSVVLREGLGVVGRKRSGEWIVDFRAMKFIRRLWVKASGGPINVRMGFADLPDGAITWMPIQSFDPATQMYLDFAGTGRAIAIEFSSTAPFRIEGYKLDGDVTGLF